MNKAFNSKKFLEKKKRAKKIKRWIFIIFVIILIVGFFYWMRHPNLNVEQINISKNNFSKTEKIKENILNTLKGNKFLLIPKTNALFLPREEIQNNIKKEFLEIEKAKIDLKGFKEINIEILEYKPEIILKNEDGSFFVNKEGNVFMEEPFLHTYSDLVVLENDKEISLGQNIIDGKFLSDLKDFIFKLKSLDINSKIVKNPEQDVYRLKTGRDFEIVISSADDLNFAYENVKTILDDGALKKEDLNLVDYIDLRFGNKVFYKLKE